MKSPYVRNVWEVVIHVDDLKQEYRDEDQKMEFMDYLAEIIAADLYPQCTGVVVDTNLWILRAFFATLGSANTLIHVWGRVLEFANSRLQ